MAFFRVRNLEVILTRREWKTLGISFRKMWGGGTEKSETLLHITAVQRAEIGVTRCAGPVIRVLQTTTKIKCVVAAILLKAYHARPERTFR